ncbi:MAG: hypothetical protein ACXW2E_00590 [Nitrososphaeraceae archaeon]
MNSLQIGDVVKHFVGNDATYMTHAHNGFLRGVVQHIYDSDSYVLKTKNAEFVLRGISKASLINGNELDDTDSSEGKPVKIAQPPQKQTIPPAVIHNKPKVVRSPRTTNGPTKRELAQQLYNELIVSNPTPIRNEVVNLFMDKLEMSKACATTYSYYFC